MKRNLRFGWKGQLQIRTEEGSGRVVRRWTACTLRQIMIIIHDGNGEK
jgi:hypothetical protein